MHNAHQRPEYCPKILKYFKQILQQFSWFEIKKMLMLNQKILKYYIKWPKKWQLGKNKMIILQSLNENY